MPTQAEVEIWNQALDEIGVGIVRSPDEKSEARRVCQRNYTTVLEELIELGDWPFLRTRVNGGLIASDRQEWGFAFSWPSDAAKIVRVLPNRDTLPAAPLTVGQYAAVPFYEEAGLPFSAHQGQAIYVGYEAVVIEYLSTTPAPENFSPLFKKALYWALAAKIVYPLKRDRQEAQTIQGTAEVWRERAVASDLNQRTMRYGDSIPEAALAQVQE